MRLSKKELGRWGEDLACGYLRKKGYRIAERNYRTPFGEIDIVALDGKTLAFIEVKTRSGDEFGGPLPAVNTLRQRRMSAAALHYLAKHRERVKTAAFRHDVITVSIRSDGKKPEIELIKNAFPLEGASTSL